MIVVKNIRVYTLLRDSLTIAWEYKNTTEQLSDYTVQVIRAESETGPWSTISDKTNASTITEFEDTTVNLHNKYRDYHYRVRAEKISDNTYQDYGSVDPDVVAKEGINPGAVVLDGIPDLEALEAIRRFDLTLREYIGQKVLVMASRSTGTRCTNCWDALKRRRKKSDCTVCYGVGVTGGYYNPKSTFACKPPESLKNQVTAFFEMQPNDIVMWFSSRPRIKPKDLVITDGRRFRVVAVQRSEKLWALTRQTVQVREITRDQIEYQITISGWSEDSKSIAPTRQFINATDINSFYDYKKDNR